MREDEQFLLLKIPPAGFPTSSRLFGYYKVFSDNYSLITNVKKDQKKPLEHVGDPTRTVDPLESRQPVFSVEPAAEFCMRDDAYWSGSENFFTNF